LIPLAHFVNSPVFAAFLFYGIKFLSRGNDKNFISLPIGIKQDALYVVGNSLGIANVYARLVLKYGMEFGL
jgi:hypothetical protein